jgi:enoyl-CoA hydratase/carnithine racemase
MMAILQQAAAGAIDMASARALSEQCLASEDLQEGFIAQREKRKPLFRGV